MECKGTIFSFLFFTTLLLVYCMVDSAKASIHTSSSHKRRSIQEQGDFGQVDLCADIIGPKWKITKEEKSPCPTLEVWVPKKTGFTEFVKVNQQDQVEGGFSIAVFCHALHLLPFNVRPIFKPFINEKGEMNGTHDQLVRHIEGQACQAVAGDLTIRANRAEYASFTYPYLTADVYMLVLASHEWNQTLWTFLKPFTRTLWFTIVGACILTGVAIAILEYRSGNPKFACSIYGQLIMVVWLPISTFFFQEGKILNKCSKVVLVMWLSMIFIVLQIFTATLSAWLTLDQLRPRLPTSFENMGYQRGSFLEDFTMRQCNCSGKHLLPLNSYEEFKDALTNRRVNAVIDILPYIDLFLSKYGSEFMKVGPINQESGIGFAFPLGSPLLQTVSKAVLNVTESETMNELKRKYLGFSTPFKLQPNRALPRSLDVKSFIGLFLFMGIVTIAAIISSEISHARRNSKIEIEEQEEEGKVTIDGHVQIKIID